MIFQMNHAQSTHQIGVPLDRLVGLLLTSHTFTPIQSVTAGSRLLHLGPCRAPDRASYRRQPRDCRTRRRRLHPHSPRPVHLFLDCHKYRLHWHLQIRRTGHCTGRINHQHHCRCRSAHPSLFHRIDLLCMSGFTSHTIEAGKSVQTFQKIFCVFLSLYTPRTSRAN